MYASSGVRPWLYTTSPTCPVGSFIKSSLYSPLAVPSVRSNVATVGSRKLSRWGSTSRKSLKRIELKVEGYGKRCFLLGNGRKTAGVAAEEKNIFGIGFRERKRGGDCLTVVGARRGFLTELQTLREESTSAPPLEFESPLQIVIYPDPRLRKKNMRISVFDERLQKLVEEMFDVMYKTDGVGLSAPQVGVNYQLMLYNPIGERGKGQEYVLVNPKIVKYGRKREVFREGCLSFPQLQADVERPITVRVEAQDLKGKKFSINLKDFQARVFQHEYDHLEGILYHDRMTPEALDTIRPNLKMLEEAYELKTGLRAPERTLDRS